MTGSATPERQQNGFTDWTSFNQTSGSCFVSKCNSSVLSSKDFPAVCFTKNSLDCAGDGTWNSTSHLRPLDENIGSCPKECAFSSSSETSQPLMPSFEFYVSSEEGINLFVDLNSNPSDWIKQLRNEVSICQNVGHKSSISQKECGQLNESHNQIRNSLTCNLDAGKLKDCQENAGSSPNFMIKDKNNMQFDHPDGGNISLTITAVERHDRTSELPEKFEEDPGLSSSNSLPIVQDKTISIPPSSSKDRFLVASCSNFLENSTANRIVNTANDPVIPFEAKYQNTSLGTGLAVPYNSPFGNNYNSVTVGDSVPVVVLKVGVHQEDPTRSPKKNVNENMVVSEQNACAQEDEFADLNEFNDEACRKHLRASIEEQNSRIIGDEENPECSQDGLLDEGLDTVEDIQELSKKRANIDDEDQHDCNSPEAKILRCSKHLIGEVLRRRSLRLVSK